jgi:hypothetical protein
MTRMDSASSSFNDLNPAGAGNAYAAAFAAGLAALLPPAATAGARTAAVLRAACRASATGAAVVAAEGLPVLSPRLQAWARAEAARLLPTVRPLPSPAAPPRGPAAPAAPPRRPRAPGRGPGTKAG